MVKVNNKYTIGVVLVSLNISERLNFEHISHLDLLFQLLTLIM